MASVIDLYTRLAEDPHLDFGMLRHVSREMQRDGILPKGRRGGGRGSPRITPQHCALFLLGLAGTSNWGDAGKTAKKLANLVRREYGEEKTTLLHDLVQTIQDHRDKKKRSDADYATSRIIFIHYEGPVVFIEFVAMKEDAAPPRTHVYGVKRRVADDRPPTRFSGYYTAAVLGGGIFDVIAEILCPLDKEDEGKAE